MHSLFSRAKTHVRKCTPHLQVWYDFECLATCSTESDTNQACLNIQHLSVSLNGGPALANGDLVPEADMIPNRQDMSRGWKDLFPRQ